MVVREISPLDDLRDKRPELQRLVRGLVVQHQVKLADVSFLLDEEQPSQELLRDRE